MDSRQHAELKSALCVFKEDYLNRVNQTYQSLEQDLTDSQTALLAQVHKRFGRIEEMLEEPYNKLLDWDWVPDSQHSRSITQTLVVRKVRLRDVPEFEVSARDYFLKYATGADEIMKGLMQLGFYLPPNTKLFEHFLQDVVEGKKLILMTCDVRKAKVPTDQVDIAFVEAQRLIFSDFDLQKYFPRGVPEQAQDKSYFLDIVHSIRGLHFKVVLPLTDTEQKLELYVRKTVQSACEELGKVQRTANRISGLKEILEEVRSPDTFGVSAFLDLYARYDASVRNAAEDGDAEQSMALDLG